jgi:hypothetical protein
VSLNRAEHWGQVATIMRNCVAEGLKTSPHLGRFKLGSQDVRIASDVQATDVD